MTTGYITLALRGALPWWLTIIVLSRDVAILMAAALILPGGWVPVLLSFPAGKSFHRAQMATLFLAMGYRARVPYITAEVSLTSSLTLPPL